MDNGVGCAVAERTRIVGSTGVGSPVKMHEPEVILPRQLTDTSAEVRAVPARLREMPTGEIVLCPAPLVFGPTLLKIATKQPQERTIPMCIRQFGFEAQRVFEASKRLLHVSRQTQPISQVYVGFHEIGL